MKSLLRKIVFVPIAFVACSPSASDRSGNNEPESTTDHGPAMSVIVSEFPAFELDELVEEISQEELVEVVTDGESVNWKRTVSDKDREELVIQNKMASDNLVRFMLYRATSKAFVAVQQLNAQISTNEIWEYVYKPNGDHPELWNQYLLTEYKVDSFFNERVNLPDGVRGDLAEPYLDYEFNGKGVTISLSKWRFMRELEGNSMQIEGPLDPALIKYKYQWNWMGEGFKEEKVNEAAYEDILTFTAQVIEQGGSGDAGPHEFDCPNVVRVTGSSSLGSHSAGNVLDGNDKTAWSEGAENDGTGEWIEFTITAADLLIGNSWQISNGFTKSKALWEENNRVKKFKVLVDDKVVAHVVLANVSSYQSFSIAPYWLKDSPSFKKGTRIRFEIVEVYRGSKYNDCVISHFVPVGNCG